ncbi:hypothetical protein RN001_003433 [Aquatica leii]|uniref:Potassium channel domain-containing protein n=1 Tax=Aquatica leii TaxID=1421715 RepID=A0AAN7SKR7_9COLE|nr:hypothetical protein RN001_003433 [Aquatica leii]
MILNRRQWVAFLFVFVVYILLGALVFYSIESKEETKRQRQENKQKQEIDDLIMKDYPDNKQNVLFSKISRYCNKPLGSVVPEVQTQLTWSFYHSIFFVLTIVSTIGYGNLSPTTPFTRTFMIIYGFIGIPINGIVIITLGEYFGTTFRKIYRRWRNKNEVRVYTTLGLIVRFIGYAIPGFALLIFIPSVIIVVYEGWTFDKAIEFAFGTLTTIGTGQFIPGTIQKENDFVYILYKAFLLIWIIIGLGYLAMFFNFITQGFQSKKMFALEHKLTKNIKKTNKKIRKELRYLLNDYIFTQTYAKPIYRERRINTLNKHHKTQSCPDLRNISDVKVFTKKRAISALPPLTLKSDKMKSDTDLENIDKIKTFERNLNNQHNDLLIKVVNALANYNDLTEYSATTTSGEINEGFEPDEFDSNWMFEKNPMNLIDVNVKKPIEAVNTAAFPLHKSNSLYQQECIEYEKYGKTRSRTLPLIQQPESLFTKFKRSIRKSITGDKPNIENQTLRQHKDPIKQKPIEHEDLNVNNDESLSDFLRALSIINFNEISKQQKAESNCSTNTKVRRLPIIPSSRRFSLNSTSSNEVKRRHSENCSSTANCINDNSVSHASSLHEFFFPRRRRLSLFGAMQKLKRSTSKHKNSVVIDIDS